MSSQLTNFGLPQVKDNVFAQHFRLCFIDSKFLLVTFRTLTYIYTTENICLREEQTDLMHLCVYYILSAAFVMGWVFLDVLLV